MVSLYMPDVQVEIAFNAGYVTPAASRTWTDVSTYVELADNIDIDFGRQDENSTADANTLTLTLDNSDGRFTALRAASPYYPNVKIGRPIRVKVTPPGGSTVTRFVGFIDEWPVEWDGSDAYAKATIRATSRMSRLGLTAKLRSFVEHEILTDSPLAYYPLGEPSGSAQANDVSGNSAAPLALSGAGVPVAFGSATGPGADGLTAAQFTYLGGQELRSSSPPTTLSTAWTVETFFSTTETSAIINIVDFGPSGSALALAPELLVDGPTGDLIARVSTSYLITASSVNVNDGATHHAAMTFAAGTLTLYLDGVSAGTVAVVGTPVFPEFELGPYEGALAHVAIFDTALSVARIAAHVDAGQEGFAGDRTDVRLLRILDWAGVASTEVDAEVGVETMTYQLTSGVSVVDALRECESTEGGVLFDGADGDVKFHNRSHRYLATAAATLNMASQHVGSDYAPRLDRSTLVNDVTVDNPTTEESARQTDTASSSEYGIATSSATSVADSYTALQEKASWLIASYAEPKIRVPSLTVDVLAHQGITPSAQTLLAVTVGDVIAVTNAPTQSDTTSPSYFVEGYAETIGPESYSITFNLSPTHPALSTFILDSATRGLLDTNILGY